MARRPRSLAPETVKLSVDDVRQSIEEALVKQAALVVLQGAESDLGTHLVLHRSVTIGRDPQAELPLADEGISRRHCRVVPGTDGTGWMVEDLKSTNGTLLNGEPLKRKTQLRAGDRISLGDSIIKFTRADAAESDYHAQLDALVARDDLTGLWAKRRFDAAYGRALETARTTHEPLAILMIDLDGLKAINDAHGHPIGAYTISEVGRLIGDSVGTDGAACRFGGDEFVVFLPGQTRARAKRFAEAIRRRVEKHIFEKDGVVVHPTVSIGLSAFPEDGETADLLMRRADEALYRAKKAGRNRVL